MDKFGLSSDELLVIAAVAFLVIGPTRIARAAKRASELLRSLRTATTGPPRPRQPPGSGRSDR